MVLGANGLKARETRYAAFGEILSEVTHDPGVETESKGFIG